MQDWLFWAIAVALTGVVLTLLIQALRGPASGPDEHPDLKVYRDQLAEVDRDLARGTLGPDEAARLRVEVSRRLLDADKASQALKPGPTLGKGYVPAGLIALALGGSLFLYAHLGAPGYPDLPLKTRLALAEDTYNTRPSQDEAEAMSPQPPAAAPSPEFADLMEKLRKTVQERPTDPQGFELLARNEAALGNYRAALDAHAALMPLLGDTATGDQQLIAAQIMIAATGGYVSPEAEAVIVSVLQKDPGHVMARYLSGLMFYQVGRPDRAFALWEPLTRDAPNDAPFRQALIADLQKAASDAGIKYTAPDEKGPDANALSAAADMTEEERSAMIEGMVQGLQDRLMSEGGSADEWIKLINALGVLGDAPRGRTATAAGEAALAADPAGLAALRAAAKAAGFAP
jgi:cytochrome c-type biogenesis protein CcmH